ncbi:MAG: phosphatidylserine decarboxylase [Lachnospiraceae bacterium]|nr:phosphatidylserine decarboxylase [Lachnospiraceae bacterium]
MNTTELLYKTRPGRLILKALVSRPVSALSGRILDSRFSMAFISPFVKSCNIDLSEYRTDGINSFNDFFCRRIKKGRRIINYESKALIAPCDGLLSVYRIDEDTVLDIKQSRFTVRSMLRDGKLAGIYKNGCALVFRLCVDNYHRYIYFDSGFKYKNRHIPGFYHTVRPVALEEFPVFAENTREYVVMDTEGFGRCVQMEIGAMLVGRIVNEEKSACHVVRGDEKGHFEYGGSTVILLIPDGKMTLRPDIKAAAGTSMEIPVKMGETIGTAL